MDAVMTEKAKEKIIQARKGICSFPKIVGIAFGNGGVDDMGNVKPVESTQTELHNELIRKAYKEVHTISTKDVVYECVLDVEDVPGAELSEMALYDSDGDLVSIKNFKKKTKDADITMRFKMEDYFD